jgi:hypothetical protein
MKASDRGLFRNIILELAFGNWGKQWRNSACIVSVPPSAEQKSAALLVEQIARNPAAYRKRNVIAYGGMIFIPSPTKQQTEGGLCTLLASWNAAWHELMKI